MSEEPDSQPPRAFRPEAFGVMLFSRGRGRGHAVPDIAISCELRRIMPQLDVRFVSYSGGAETLRSRGYDVVDLDLLDEAPFPEAIIRQTRVIGFLRPQLVLAHEELPALVASRVFQTPCVFITDFFPDPTSPFMGLMQYADEIVFTAEPGIYTEPPFMSEKIHYAGPAVRRFDYGRADRERARAELGIPAGAVVVLCQPGNWPEAQVPMADLLTAAWDALPYPSKRLTWLAWRDYERLRSRFDGRPDITIIKEDWQIDRLIVTSDLVITKANRLTVYEAASFGVPSISISNGANWPDDVAVQRVRSNSALHVRAIAPDALARLMIDKIAGGWLPENALPKWNGVEGAARRIAAHVGRMQRGAA